MNWTEEEYAAFLKSKGAKNGEKPEPAKKKSKYNNVKTNGYDSKHESDIAAELHLREKAEKIRVFEQVPFGLVPGTKYIADFVLLYPDGRYEVMDAKGFKTKEYILKKKMLKELWGLEIIEV